MGSFFMPKMSPSTEKSDVGDRSVTGSTPVIARLVTVVTVVTVTFIKRNYYYIVVNIYINNKVAELSVSSVTLALRCCSQWIIE